MDLIEKDLKYIWHPYTQMKDCQSQPPVLIEKARGVCLYDDKGNMYYDTISSWWCNVHGHNHPDIKNAIKKQLDSLEHVLFAGFTHKPAVLLAEKLISISPDKLTKIFFSDNGSTSVEVALKMSFQYWRNIGKSQKNKFVCLENGYHGDTIGAMSVSGISLFRDVFAGLLFSSYKAPSPYCYRCKNRDASHCLKNVKRPGFCNMDCIEPLEKILKEKNQEIAAVILEPMVQAAGGRIIYPVEYLIKAAELAQKFNVHLIVDEVATGFGRTGKMFACEHAGIEPDFMCLSKGITSGYLPLGATLTTDRIYEAFYDDYEKKKTFYHGHTQTANPLSVSAALASFEIFEKENTLDRAGELSPLLHHGLQKISKLPYVGDVRHIGMIGAVELVRDKKTKDTFKFEERMGMKIYGEGLKRGVILRPLGDVIYLFLPLCIERDELEEILSRVYEIIEKIT
jgi:adenosylmethionine-8-amino-7-oxononanoate aminotransferase